MTDWRRIRQNYNERYGGCLQCGSQNPGMMLKHDVWNKYFHPRDYLCTRCISLILVKKRGTSIQLDDLLDCPWNTRIMKVGVL